MLITELVNVATFRTEAPSSLANVLATLGIALIPISMGIAILRYGLYDIDRIISRTVGYAVVTGILAVIFGGAVVLLSTVLSQLAQGQAIAVAASTLAVTALSSPSSGGSSESSTGASIAATTMPSGSRRPFGSASDTRST